MGAWGNASWQRFRTVGEASGNRAVRRSAFLARLYSYLSTLAVTLAVASAIGAVVFFLLICRPHIKHFDHEVQTLIVTVMTLSLLIGSGIWLQGVREEIRTRRELEHRESREIYNFKIRSRAARPKVARE